MEATVLQEIAALQRMSLAQLRQRWQSLFGSGPPGYSAEQMVRRLAYRLQELRYGGLSVEVEETLRKAQSELKASGSKRRKHKANTPAPGTRLVRHWGGQAHEVTVCHDGTFEYAGRRFRTLSAAAKAITGQHCSGPGFFGLPVSGKKVTA